MGAICCCGDSPSQGHRLNEMQHFPVPAQYNPPHAPGSFKKKHSDRSSRSTSSYHEGYAPSQGHSQKPQKEGWSTGQVAVAGIGGLAVGAGIAYAMSGDNDQHQGGGGYGGGQYQGGGGGYAGDQYQGGGGYGGDYGGGRESIPDYGGGRESIPDGGGRESIPDYGGGRESLPDAMPAAAPGSFQEAERAVNMYAGGEDDRPGRGDPPPDAGTAVRVPLAATCPGDMAIVASTTIPPEQAADGKHASGTAAAAGQHRISKSEAARGKQVDPRLWLQEQLEFATPSERESLLGATSPLPFAKEVLFGDATEAKSDICLVTQCSVDRLPRLEQQLKAWQGDVSVAVYIDAEPLSDCAESCRERVLACVAAASSTRSLVVTALYRLDECHVRCAAYDLLYPVNALRNAALEHAAAEIVLTMDVDFIPSQDLYGNLTRAGDKHLRKLLHTSMALVLPAFEVPELGHCIWNAETICAAWKSEQASGFHTSYFPQGHRATDYNRWFAAESSDAVTALPTYSVTYEEHFEPYFFALRSSLPSYDERFRGYGLNKISHVYEMNATGFTFRVLDSRDCFVVAAEHKRSASWQQMYGPGSDRLQRIRLAAHWESFKEDTRHRTEKAGTQAEVSSSAGGGETCSDANTSSDDECATSVASSGSTGCSSKAQNTKMASKKQRGIMDATECIQTLQ